MSPPDFGRTGDLEDWQARIKSWLDKHWKVPDSLSYDIISFFDLAFENTRCPDHAWFGVHKRSISLVVGGLFLAAIHMGSRQNSGLWFLVDQNPPPIDGVDYEPCAATKGSKFPLIWAHSPVLSVIPHINTNDLIWQSFAVASEKLQYCRPCGPAYVALQQRYKKERLSEFWHSGQRLHLFLDEDEVENELLIREGARCQVTVSRYERDPRARKRCIEHHGTTCLICGFSFKAVYGQVAEGLIHVHHLRPQSEIGSEYEINPVNDLIPVCPNCHAIFHLRKPALTVEEVRELLQTRGDQPGVED